MFSCLVDLLTIHQLTEAQKDIQIMLLRPQVRVLQRSPVRWAIDEQLRLPDRARISRKGAAQIVLVNHERLVALLTIAVGGFSLSYTVNID